MMVGFPLPAGKGISGHDGALAPISGAGEVSTGDGEKKEDISSETVILSGV
jgi:hypothetical protein